LEICDCAAAGNAEEWRYAQETTTTLTLTHAQIELLLASLEFALADLEGDPLEMGVMIYCKEPELRELIVKLAAMA
jgi:hypothetical protein